MCMWVYLCWEKRFATGRAIRPNIRADVLPLYYPQRLLMIRRICLGNKTLFRRRSIRQSSHSIRGMGESLMHLLRDMRKCAGGFLESGQSFLRTDQQKTHNRHHYCVEL